MILSLLSETTGGSDMEFDKQHLEHFLTVSKVEIFYFLKLLNFLTSISWNTISVYPIKKLNCKNCIQGKENVIISNKLVESVKYLRLWTIFSDRGAEGGV